MSKNEQQYLNLCKHILKTGTIKVDRTNIGTKSVFGYQMRFNLQEGFPLLTTKKVPIRLIASELLWFIKGDTNIKYLLQHNNNIWNEWAFKNWVESKEYNGPDMTNFGLRANNDEAFNELYKAQMNIFKNKILEDDAFAAKFGELGPVYGKQWRKWETSNREFFDQLAEVIDQIKRNPDSRRHLVVAYNPGEVKSMSLPPCHSLFQFYVADGKLSCQMYQRSGDTFLGIPFNIASYALLTHLVASECNLKVGEFIHTLGDAHIYLNHMDQVKLQGGREKRPLPKLILKNPGKSIFDMEPEDIVIEGYDPHPAIKAPVAV